MSGRKVAGVKGKASGSRLRASGRQKAEARSTKPVADPRQTVLDDVAAAVDSGRYLILVARIDANAPTGKELKTRHHTRNFPSGDFQTLVDVERPKFFAALHS